MLRVDGKAFHSYTKKIGTKRPYDFDLMDRMNETTRFLCENIQGAQLAYVQSDEISILFTDFAKIETDLWFDGNIQKIVSITSSLATGFFNSYKNPKPEILAFFDARVFTIPDPYEVDNYFLWRQQDWLRNSLSMLARSHYSHKELHGKSTSDMHEMLYRKDVNWAKERDDVKNGRICLKTEDGWNVTASPDFGKDRQFLRSRIPLMESWK
jgi:tRNA(His) 5'-end guanylyltransferase